LRGPLGSLFRLDTGWYPNDKAAVIKTPHMIKVMMVSILWCPYGWRSSGGFDQNLTPRMMEKSEARLVLSRGDKADTFLFVF